MKIMIRSLALLLVISAALVGNSLPSAVSAAAITSSNVPGPMPTCNPFTQKCPVIRSAR